MTTNKIEKKGPDTIGSILTAEENRRAIKNMIGRGLDADTFMNAAWSAIKKNPAIARCDPWSVYEAIKDAAALNLMPSSITNEGHFVPYRGKCQFIAGYKGILKLAHNSGNFSVIDVREVYTNDEFYYRYGLDPTVDHTPADGDRGEYKGSYAVIRTKDGERKFEYLSKADAERHALRFSANKDGKTGKLAGPWKDHFEAMAGKTVLRKVFKYFPFSTTGEALQRQLIKSEFIEAGLDVIDLEPTPDPIKDPQQGSDKAEGTPVFCQTCDGTGQENGNGDVDCPACNGEGVVAAK